MTLNLQSKPALLSSQSELLLSMSQIRQIRNYLQFRIWGCPAHTIPSNKLLEQRDRMQSTQEARAEIILLPSLHLTSSQRIARPHLCQSPESPCRAGCQQQCQCHAFVTVGAPESWLTAACPSDKHQQPELTCASSWD